MLPGITKYQKADEVTEILKRCTISGTTVTLPPGQLDRKIYLEVSKKLELIGGQWNRKAQGFIFKEDPTELMADICNGQKRNIQKEFQFFETPPELADWLVELAEIIASDKILEPSAGQGALVKAIMRANNNINYVDCCELMPINKKILATVKGANDIGGDFLLQQGLYNYYNKVIANPPFSKNQDIDHIIKMYLCCRPGGRIVSMASKHWQIGPEKKCQQFREWLDEIGAEVKEVPAGTFKASGTTIETVCIVINK